MLKPIFSFISVALMTLASGCAVQSVQPGASREEVVSRYGTPSRVVALASGTRLQYSQQPAGQSAVMVDLDATGRVTQVREVLNPAGFSAVVVGQSTREDTLRALGRPAMVDRVASWPGDILTYRWRDHDLDMLYWFYLDASQVVQRTGQAAEIPIRTNDN
jgi:hypothetical protein